MILKLRSRITQILFKIGIISKGIDGLLEIVGGFILFFITPIQIHSLIQVLTQHELSEDPKDIIANYLLNSTWHLTAGTKNFAAIYLLWHGFVKAGLVVALLLRKRWSYPTAIFAFFLFLIYQLYRYSHTSSPELLILSGVDIFVIILTWLEYRRLRKSSEFSSSPSQLH
jgi:uncharacterized membrane protein